MHVLDTIEFVLDATQHSSILHLKKMSFFEQLELQKTQSIPKGDDARG